MTTRTPEQPDDADLERLRAADPAADATPDATALEAAVRDRVPEAVSFTPLRALETSAPLGWLRRRGGGSAPYGRR